jgi:hypothetical protein
VPDGYGIGLNAMLANATAEDLTAWHITGVPTDFRLQAGDVITVSYTQGATFHTVPVTVTTWTGDGTTERFLTMATPMTGVTWTGSHVTATTLHLDSPLGSVALSFTAQNISVTGSNATIGKCDYPQLVNSLRMTTGYDDAYNITPWKHVQQIYDLGYRGDVVCYMGASHYYKATSSLVSSVYYNRLDTTATSPLNTPTVNWVQSFCAELHSRGLGLIWSTSLEILYSQIPTDWAQKDVDDALAQSGYTPPTSFLNFTDADVRTYLVNVIKQGLGLMQTAGLSLKVQLGEWWYWDGSYTNNKPCIYAYSTKVLYNTETGLFAPTTITNIYQQPLTSDETAYCTWLGQKLGAATAAVRDAVKATYLSTQFCLLFFSPQIFNSSSVILPLINFPVSDWSYPNWDFMQIEDYDWIIAGQMDKLPQTVHAATVTLGYPINLVHYFIGFVRTASDSGTWPRMSEALSMAIDAGITNNYVWAYPQVIRDGITNALIAPKGCVLSTANSPYSYNSPGGALKNQVVGPVVAQELQWDRGVQIYNGTMILVRAQLTAWLVFVYHVLNRGANTFELPMDSGQGVKRHAVNLLPGSQKIEHAGQDVASVSMQLEGEASYYAGS